MGHQHSAIDEEVLNGLVEAIALWRHRVGLDGKAVVVGIATDRKNSAVSKCLMDELFRHRLEQECELEALIWHHGEFRLDAEVFDDELTMMMSTSTLV